MIKFEYDERKSQSNLEKHGIDFVDAQALWNDPYLMIMPLAPGKVAAYLLKPNDIKDTRLSITPLLAYEFSK